MIDNLTDAIAHAKEVAEKNRQDAEELRELGERVSPPNQPYNITVKACLDCAEDHEQLVAWLTELQERREADRWIPVSERLPEKEGWYLVDRKERTSSIQYFFFSTVNHKPYWSGECKVYYWRPLPEPYKESEDEV